MKSFLPIWGIIDHKPFYLHVFVILYIPVDEMRWFLKLHWIVYNMAAAPAMLTCLFYWNFVYKNGEQ